VSTYTVTLLGKYLTYALLAVAVDLVWGYLGILSSAMARSSRSAAMRWACT
jgi:ABC-type branched-subunit amino acid transport system permease subunit